jgi:hypothetical protein
MRVENIWGNHDLFCSGKLGNDPTFFVLLECGYTYYLIEVSVLFPKKKKATKLYFN